MGIDFESFSGRSRIDSLTSPQDVFTALPAKKAHLGYLRDGQGQVLKGWGERREERDLVIKVNTGGGKTVVGLLILRTCLNEGRGPALYVAPDKYLASQVRKQADDLGIETVDDPDNARYLSGEAIGVVNIFSLVNGMSKFGGPGSPRVSPVPIGSLVIDDAHAALATTEEQYTITLPVDHPLYSRLIEKFKVDLEEQGAAQFLALRDADAVSPPQRIPFWAWARESSSVAALLHEHRDDDGIKWKWPLLRDHLSICQAVATSRAIEIQPPCPPINDIQSFRQAKRRIFLTATLADDSVLVNTFDARPDSIKKPITPESAADLGDRMILAPQEINPEISEDDIKAAVSKLAETYNVVVLAPSDRRARYWGDVAAIVASGGDVEQTVEQLRATHVGLVVLSNKYDGIDLPDDACRVLVVDGLPEVYGGIAHREAALLGDADSLFGRQMQRIEQGMGRGVRSANDYCVILLHGFRLTQKIATPSLRTQFSPLTRAQLDLSKEVATTLAGTSMDELIGVMEQSLNRDPGWIRVSREAVAGVKYPPGHVSTSAQAQRGAFNEAAVGQFQPAAGRLRDAINVEDSDGVRGVLQEQMAVYTNFFDEPQAQQVLVGALRTNPRVLRPMSGVTYSRLPMNLNQAQAIADYLSEKYSSANDLLIGVRSMTGDLVFDPDATREFEDAMEELGKHLGLGSQRPERDLGNGPDVLWAVGDNEYLVIECKSGATTEEISRKQIQQLIHSLTWFSERYDATNVAKSILVHPSNVMAKDAIAPQGCRAMTPSFIEKLCQSVLSVAEALAASGTWADPTSVIEQIRHHKLLGKEIALVHALPTRAHR